jgi:hypothetical protein
VTDLSREDQKRMWSAIDFLASLGRDGALATIAMATHAERPEWPLTTIFDELGKDMRDLHEIAHAAVTAARSTGPNRTKHPAGIRTTFPGSAACSVCAQREQAQHAGPPRVLECSHCGKPDTADHACTVNRPSNAWHTARKILASKFEPLIRDARNLRTIEGNDAAEKLIAEQMRELNGFARLSAAEQSEWLAVNQPQEVTA